MTTASFTFTVSVSGLAKSLGTISLSGSGQADLVNDAGSLSATLPASVAKLIPGGSAAPEVVNAVLSGGTVYVEVPSLATLLGEPWISVALPSSATSGHPGDLHRGGWRAGRRQRDPRLRPGRITPRCTRLGSSTVDGTSVTGSRITAHVKR